MRKLVAHCTTPEPLPIWGERLLAMGYLPVTDDQWRRGDFVLTLQLEDDLWLHGEGESLAAGAVTALLELAVQLSSGGELELFEEDGRLLQRHSF